MHGANATGKPFIGGDAGNLLYRTLYDFDFPSAPVSRGPGDGLSLLESCLTNLRKCRPPDNKFIVSELNGCSRFLVHELAAPSVMVALGGIAHKAVVRALGRHQKDHVFGYGAQHALSDAQTLIDSYHCGRYNLNTGRLSAAMFAQVFAAVRAHLA
jgi:uracil-DNA glycosylase family 4